MARKDTMPERLAVLETEWPHLQSTIGRLESELRELRQMVRQYARVAGMLGIAAAMHWPGAYSAELAGRSVKPLLELFLRAL